VTISNDPDAISGGPAPRTIDNAGTNAGTGTTGVGIDLTSGGSVSNAAAASIAGGYSGVYIDGGGGTVVNAGSVAGTPGAGVRVIPAASLAIAR
jgi:fibronectin-binding autotransporter adhesin